MQNSEIINSIAIPEYWQICVSHYVNVRDSNKEKFLLTMQNMNMKVEEILDSHRNDLVIYKWTNPKYEKNEEYMTEKWLDEMNPSSELRKHILSDKRPVPIVEKLHYENMITVYKPFDENQLDAYSKNILFSLSTNDLCFQQEYANAITFTGNFSLEHFKLLSQHSSDECYRFKHTAGMNERIRMMAMQDIFDSIEK